MNKVVTSKEEILEAGRRIAMTDGVPAINIRRVASECGVSVGSVYNYFPSKAELVAASVEAVWVQIFHEKSREMPEGFEDRVRWFFDTARLGSKEYPAFFTMHAMGFAPDEKKTGTAVMSRFFAHMKNGLAQAIENDERIRQDAFSDSFTKEAFVDFVFSNLLALLVSGAGNCDFLIEMIDRAVC